MKGERNSSPALTWLIPLVVAILSLAMPAIGQAAEPGSISGTVTAKVDGAPVSGVEVCAEGEAEEAYGCAVTDGSGEYEIRELPAGTYTVEFWARPVGYLSQVYDGKESWSEATPVTVTAGLPTTGIDAELELGGTISGRVTAAATGLPVARVEVCAYAAGETEGGCDITDATGVYSIEGLRTGQFEVYFWTGETGGELVSQPYGSGPVALVAGQARTGIDAALQVGGQIAGTVRLAATGAGIKGVQACIMEAGEAWPLGCLRTPASGKYRFTGLWAGTFKVVFSPEAGELVEGDEFGIAPDPYPTQWWSGQSTFATATPIAIAPPSVVEGVDGSLGPGPVLSPPASAPSALPATAVVKPKPKPPKCKRHSVKKKVKGKARCVKRHKAKRHHLKHHPTPRKHASR